MTKLLSFACGAVLLAAVAAPGFAYDDDPGASGVSSPRVREVSVKTITRTPTYGIVAYYPTLRYYGKNGTIAYGFVGLARADLRRVTEPYSMMVSPAQVAMGGVAPRMVVAGNRPFFRATKKITTVTTETDTQAAPVTPVPPPAEATPATAPAPIPEPTPVPPPAPVPAPADGAK